MNVRQSYDLWASLYDTNENKTRDLEGVALRAMLNGRRFNSCLEIGCGTGKNTAWLAEHADQVTAVDLSEKMLEQARKKISFNHVSFHQTDVTAPWSFGPKQFDLITFSLVVEHIENLRPVFAEAVKYLVADGFIYLGELHPFKQYMGSKARFETENANHIVPCFNHHLTDFTGAAIEAGLTLADLNEYFDEGDRAGIPRILAMILTRTNNKCQDK